MAAVFVRSRLDLFPGPVALDHYLLRAVGEGNTKRHRHQLEPAPEFVNADMMALVSQVLQAPAEAEATLHKAGLDVWPGKTGAIHRCHLAK